MFALWQIKTCINDAQKCKLLTNFSVLTIKCFPFSSIKETLLPHCLKHHSTNDVYNEVWSAIYKYVPLHIICMRIMMQQLFPLSFCLTLFYGKTKFCLLGVHSLFQFSSILFWSLKRSEKQLLTWEKNISWNVNEK